MERGWREDNKYYNTLATKARAVVGDSDGVLDLTARTIRRA